MNLQKFGLLPNHTSFHIGLSWLLLDKNSTVSIQCASRRSPTFCLAKLVKNAKHVEFLARQLLEFLRLWLMQDSLGFYARFTTTLTTASWTKSQVPWVKILTFKILQLVFCQILVKPPQLFWVSFDLEWGNVNTDNNFHFLIKSDQTKRGTFDVHKYLILEHMTFSTAVSKQGELNLFLFASFFCTLRHGFGIFFFFVKVF